MVIVTPENDIVAVNAGWGSMTDKKGIRTIAKGIGVITSYNEVFGITPKRGTSTAKSARGVSTQANQSWAKVFNRVRERQAFLNRPPAE
jgi:hypothetical protein